MHRAGAFFIAGLITLAFSAAAGAAVGEPVNLISNGGFEEGLVGWSPDPGQTLVAQPKEAHSGAACLTGEVTAENKALILRRQIPVKPGNRYRFEIWARAAGGTKLVLFAVPPGAGEKGRQSVAAWTDLSRKWQKCEADLPVRAAGMLGLEVIAPSSHGAPPGRIWIDDVAVYETPLPVESSASGDKGYNDEPAMVRTDDGSIYVAWNSFRDGADSLQLARYKLQGDRQEPAGAWQVLGGKGTYVLGPALVSDGKDVALLYAAEKDKNWDVYAVVCGPDGPGRPLAVGSHPAVDWKPAGAWHKGTLWVAWESNRGGSHQVFAASVAGGKASEAAAVSAPGVSSYDPSVAALAGGEVCVAWHAFRENNYDIYLRRRSAAGAWGAESRLTKAPTIDRHAYLLARGDDLWLIYENANVVQYHIGATNLRRLVVAKVTPEGLMTPVLAQPKCPLDARSEAPAACFDQAGRLWLAFLRPLGKSTGWGTMLTVLAGDRWLPERSVSVGKGEDRRPGLVLDGRRAVVCYQSDDIKRFTDEKQSELSTSRVSLAVCDLGDLPAAAPAKLAPLAESPEPFEPAGLRVARGEDSPPASITYQGKTLKLLFGDLHQHTDISQCNRTGDQTLDEGYQHMRDIAAYNFACATDHGYNENPYLWYYTAKLARANDDPGRFLTFLAEEWTSTFEEYSEKHPYGFYGHRNLIFADPYFPRWWNAVNRQTPAQVWEDLRKMNANFIHIPHQLADTGNVPTDWNFTDEKAQPVAEIFQTRGSYEYSGAPREAKRSVPKPGYFLQDAWARGIVIGVIASPDHGGGYGKACVYAPELAREAVLDALRARHCYGTTAAKIVLDVRVAGRLMGEKVRDPAPRSVPVEIRVRCPGDIDRVEVCRNNQFIYTKNPEGRACELTFTDTAPLAGRSYYYVRVIQKDEEIAWSSPVWFGAE
jgi:hypothetical protein